MCHFVASTFFTLLCLVFIGFGECFSSSQTFWDTKQKIEIGLAFKRVKLKTRDIQFMRALSVTSIRVAMCLKHHATPLCHRPCKLAFFCSKGWLSDAFGETMAFLVFLSTIKRRFSNLAFEYDC